MFTVDLGNTHCSFYTVCDTKAVTQASPPTSEVFLFSAFHEILTLIVFNILLPEVVALNSIVQPCKSFSERFVFPEGVLLDEIHPF